MRAFLFLMLAVSFTQQVFAGSDTTRIRRDLAFMTGTTKPRNYRNTDVLNQVAAYIHDEFRKNSDSVSYQVYQAGGREYRNVICSFGTENKERIIIGAHYDVCGDQPGADDNGSGTAGLLELSRMLKGQKLRYRVDLVAFTLEEPPFFRTEYMGSYVHAKYLHDNKLSVKGMISLEMIGYFDDAKGSQQYPVKPMKWIYGSKGNYITVVNKWGKGRFARKFSHKMKRGCQVRTKKIAGPVKVIPGLDLSDHRSYWKFGYSALMITDTAFFRNMSYHEPSDTMHRLDLARMAKVIDGVYLSLISLQ